MKYAPHDWQEPAVAAHITTLAAGKTVLNASEMGTGKTLITCFAAKRAGRELVVVCPKSVVADWVEWGERLDLSVTALSYGKVRTGKTALGRWQIKTKDAKAFVWTLPPQADLVFDEAHECAGIDTQQSELLCAARRQRIRTVLLSGTAAENPLKMRALGYALGLHSLHDFWPWAARKGVTFVPRNVFVRGHERKVMTPEWPYLTPSRQAQGARIMEGIRQEIGDAFIRLRKADIPNFPEKQVIPLLLPTARLQPGRFETGEYGYEARMEAERLKIEPLCERIRDDLSAGRSVVVFVNYLDVLTTLHEAFPEASVIFGGQTSSERTENIRRFQANETHVILAIAAAGGTGVNLHDLHGRQRVTYLFPGTSAVRFLQAIDRIHRAGAVSHATIYVAFASGCRIERRSRTAMEGKLSNLSALNDSDLLGLTTHNNASTDDQDPDAPGGLPEDSGDDLLPGGCLSNQRDQSGGHEVQPGPGRPDADPLPDRGREPRPGGASDGDRPDHPCDVGEREGAGAAAGHAPHAPDGPPAGVTQVPEVPPLMVTPNAPTPAPADATGNHVVRKHARCSPSKLKNLELCPSYEPDNDSPVHPITLRGTAMHEALETGDDSKLLPEDGEELRLVTMCRDFQAAEAVPGEVVITEPHLKTHDRDVQGFADRVVLEPATCALDEAGNEVISRRARIRDYKMGWNAVDDPKDNPQAIAYTVAVFMAYPDVTEVDFAFLIPRLGLVLTHLFDRAELPALKLRLSVIAERTRKLAGLEFNVVESNCLYCGRKATCEALAAKALPLARKYAEDTQSKLPLPSSFNPAQLTNPQDIAYGLNLASIMESWVEQMRRHATTMRRENGVEIPGYDWIERSAKREVSNPVAAYEVVKEMGVSQEAFLSAARVSITQLQAVVEDAAPKGQKAAAAEKMNDRLIEAMAVTRGAPFFVLQRSRKKAPTPTLPDSSGN